MCAAGSVLDLPGGLRGELAYRVPMARHVSWRAGGEAERVYRPADLEDLATFLQGLDEDEPIHFVGLGSNLLVRDGGLRGTVVLLHGALNHIRIEQRSQGMHWADKDPGQFGVLYAEAGVAAPKVARYAARHDLVGAEFLAGIPGTLGGALAMNAGCYGHETWEYVAMVQTLDRRGQLHRRLPSEFEVGYRHVELISKQHADTPCPLPNPLPQAGEGANERYARQNPVHEWFVAAWLLLPRGHGEASREEIRRLLARRVASQPLGLPNAGSVFRNPPGDFAARLIEQCGLKGRRLGHAQVSEKHANFIVNLGGATAADIEALIETVQGTVAARTGVELQREVRIIGDK